MWQTWEHLYSSSIMPLYWFPIKQHWGIHHLNMYRLMSACHEYELMNRLISPVVQIKTRPDICHVIRQTLRHQLRRHEILKSCGAFTLLLITFCQGHERRQRQILSRCLSKPTRLYATSATHHSHAAKLAFPRVTLKLPDPVSTGSRPEALRVSLHISAEVSGSAKVPVSDSEMRPRKSLTSFSVYLSLGHKQKGEMLCFSLPASYLCWKQKGLLTESCLFFTHLLSWHSSETRRPIFTRVTCQGNIFAFHFQVLFSLLFISCWSLFTTTQRKLIWSLAMSDSSV